MKVSASITRTSVIAIALLANIGISVACSAVLLGLSVLMSASLAAMMVSAVGYIGIRLFNPWCETYEENFKIRELPHTNTVEIRNFSFAYRKKPTLLRIPRLDFNGPRLTAIVGPSGVGKSSLVSLIAAQEQWPYEGSLKVFGQEWKALAKGRDVSRQAHRRKIGYIPQSYGLLPDWTVKQTLAQDLQDADVPKREHGDRIDHALHEMGITDHRDSVIRDLSGGQQQRVAIARMLARRVQLIVADEPTANLDPRTKRDVVASLRRAGQNALVLIVTHDPWVANQCDDMVVLAPNVTPAYFGPQPSVAITSKEPGHLEIWRFGAESDMTHQWKWKEGSWSHFDSMEAPQRDAPIIRLTGGFATGGSCYEILAVDSDGKAWRRQWEDSIWLDWTADDPSKDIDSVTGVRSVSMSTGGSSTRQWWATLNDGRIVYKRILADIASCWTELDTPEDRQISTLAAGTIDELRQVNLIAIDTSGHTWHRWCEREQWAAWQELEIADARSATLTSGQPDHLEMWVVTKDGKILHRWWCEDSRLWSEWNWMDTPEDLQVVSICGTSQGDGEHGVIVETADGTHWYRWYFDNRWSYWASPRVAL